MLNRFLPILIVSLVAANSLASTAGQFTPVYTDISNKLSWSKTLPGEYSNGCVDGEGKFDSSKCTFETLPDGSRRVKVSDSDAAGACRDLGVDGVAGLARLPTKSEFESLIRNFNYNETNRGPVLTANGRADMQVVFGDMDNWFWSSSTPSVYSGSAFMFNGYSGHIDEISRHGYGPLAVRCVVAR